MGWGDWCCHLTADLPMSEPSHSKITVAGIDNSGRCYSIVPKTDRNNFQKRKKASQSTCVIRNPRPLVPKALEDQELNYDHFLV